MVEEKVSGARRVISKGKPYYYHRATGERIKADPADHAAFKAEVERLNATVAAPEQPKPTRSVGGLIQAYKGSPEWEILAADTHKAYNRVFDAIIDLDTEPARNLNQARILKIRDSIYQTNGRWLANQTVAVMSVVLGWSVPRGLVTTNAAKGVPKIRRSRSAGVANKAWYGAEVRVLLDRTKGGLRKAVALAYYGGLRKKDCVEVAAAERTGSGWLELVSSKPGRMISIFEAKRLTQILDEKDGTEGDTLVRNLKGEAYTRDGLDTLFHRLKKELVEEGLIRPGLTFHGLRKSLGKDAADMAMGENAIAGALGQANPASARPYTVEHAQREASRKVIRALERRGKR